MSDKISKYVYIWCVYLFIDINMKSCNYKIVNNLLFYF